MSVPVHPICSGGKPDSNGGVAQGLRDAVDCSLQPSGRITTEAKSGGEGCSSDGRSEDKGSGNQTVMQSTRDYHAAVLVFLFIIAVGQEIQWC